MINDFEQSYYLLDRKHGSLTRLFKPGDYAIRSPLVVGNSFLFAAGEGICCVDLEENRLYPALADESAGGRSCCPCWTAGVFTGPTERMCGFCRQRERRGGRASSSPLLQ